ncbi:unnamed protein product [Sphagnum jensenii]|uniref:Uncharacterized protein n=1 Tax=Sphagnum jensenii TaxID=128206 RepID=A0ABP1AZR5_9BRYO
MAQVLHGGKLIVTVNMLEGKIQFLFGNAKSMAQIVGVGLDFATVSLTRQNVIVVEGITKLEWTTLWGEVFLGESLFENPIFMEEVVISPPDHEEPQGSHVNALTTVAMFFMIQKFLQNLDVGKAYNQVVRGVATTMTEDRQSDIGLVHAKSVNDRSTGILGFNLWDSVLPFKRWHGSATRNTSGEGGSHLGGTNTPSEGDKNQGGSATRNTSGEGGSHLGGTNTPSEGDKDQDGSATRNTSGGGGSHLGGTNTPSEEDKDQDGSATRNTSGGGGSHLGGTNTPSGEDKDKDGSATRNTSGGGGSHLGGTNTPSEGDKDQGGNGRDDDDSHQDRGSKGQKMQQNTQCEISVTVVPGYEPGVWSRDIDPTPEQLKESYISPILTFLFKKAGNNRSIKSTINVCCGMEATSLGQVNHGSERFGWCQNHIHASLQCLQPGAATLGGESSLLGTKDLKDIFTEQTQATCPQAKFGVTAGYHRHVSASASVDLPLKSTLTSNQRMTEMPSEFISGTGFHASCHDKPGPLPMFQYAFDFRPQLPPNMFPDGPDQEKYDGMRCTVYPSFEGVWIALKDTECEYKLQVERHVCELVVAQSLSSLNPKTWAGGKEKLPCNCNKMSQTYEVKLLINHQMLGIETLQKFGKDELTKDKPKNALLELLLDDSGRGPHGASSSTQ